MHIKKGSLYLFIGPSGVGKTTLAKALMQSKRCSNLKVVPSYTTRPPRPGEKPGVDYHFISQADFEQKLAAGFFIEYSTAYKNAYGSRKSEVLQALSEGFDVLLVVDRAGARSIKRELPETIVISIVPPGMAVLEQRLRLRTVKMTPEIAQDIIFRLKKAAEEASEEEHEYLAQYIIVNDDLDEAVEQLACLMCRQKSA